MMQFAQRVPKVRGARQEREGGAVTLPRLALVSMEDPFQTGDTAAESHR